MISSFTRKLEGGMLVGVNNQDGGHARRHGFDCIHSPIQTNTPAGTWNFGGVFLRHMLSIIIFIIQSSMWRLLSTIFIMLLGGKRPWKGGGIHTG